MIIKIHGTTKFLNLGCILRSVAEDIQKRAELNSSDIAVKDAEVGVLFETESGLQGIEVEHEGIKEIFTVHVQLDEEGKIKTKVDNEAESFMDDYSRAIQNGDKWEGCKNEIESVFNEEDLNLLSEEKVDCTIIKIYEHTQGFRVKRYYRKNKEDISEILVAEIGIENK